MVTKGKPQSLLQVGSKRHWPLVERNMKRIAHKRGESTHSSHYNKKGSRRTSRR